MNCLDNSFCGRTFKNLFDGVVFLLCHYKFSKSFRIFFRFFLFPRLLPRNSLSVFCWHLIFVSFPSALILSIVRAPSVVERIQLNRTHTHTYIATHFVSTKRTFKRKTSPRRHDAICALADVFLSLFLCLFHGNFYSLVFRGIRERQMSIDRFENASTIFRSFILQFAFCILNVIFDVFYSDSRESACAFCAFVSLESGTFRDVVLKITSEMHTAQCHFKRSISLSLTHRTRAS